MASHSNALSYCRAIVFHFFKPVSSVLHRSCKLNYKLLHNKNYTFVRLLVMCFKNITMAVHTIKFVSHFHVQSIRELARNFNRESAEMWVMYDLNRKTDQKVFCVSYWVHQTDVGMCWMIYTVCITREMHPVQINIATGMLSVCTCFDDSWTRYAILAASLQSFLCICCSLYLKLCERNSNCHVALVFLANFNNTTARKTLWCGLDILKPSLVG